jgi:RNA polymerase sigma-70 factor, ECF subfamily
VSISTDPRAVASKRPAAEPRDARSLDHDSREWLRSLRTSGATRDEAIARLHAILLQAASFEVARRRRSLPHLRDALDEVALEAADDALVSVLARLDDFRADSRFTTWAYKFALLEAGVKLRRRAWQGREVVLEPGMWPTFADPSSSAHELVERGELLSMLRQTVEQTLTPHQREVFVSLALNGVPIDVLAERLGTSRGALYKTLHDARRKLRRELSAAGLVEPEASVIAQEES